MILKPMLVIVTCVRARMHAQSRPTLCNPMGYGPPGSSVHRVFQARMLEWVAISSSTDLPDPGIEPTSPALQADSLPLSHLGSPKCPVDVSNHHYYHSDDQIKGVFKDPGDLENP